MTDLREKVALNMVNALRRSYGFNDNKNIKSLDEMQDRDADAYRVEAQAAIDTVFAELMSDEVLRVACAANNLNFPTMICINGMEAALSTAIAQLKGE